MPKLIGDDLRALLESSAVNIQRKVEVFYEAPWTQAKVTMAVDGEIFFSENFNICYGPVVRISELSIEGVDIPIEEITFRDGRK
jgi:hypothetical protein